MSAANAIPESAQPGNLLLHLRWLLFRNGARLTLRHSALRIIMILGLSSIVWMFVFIASLEGFTFLQLQWPLSGDMLGGMFDITFFALGILLTFSSGIMLYGSLFGAPESAFLLSSPLLDDRIFAYNYFGALSFSSWGFVLLGSPVFLAYGMVYKQPQVAAHGASWLFFVLLPCYFLGFVLIPGSLGAMLCLAVVNTFPRKQLTVLLLAGAVVVGVVALLVVEVSTQVRSQQWNPDLLQRLIGKVSFAQHPLMPSHWMGRGVRASARGDVLNSLFPLALLWSHGLVLFVAATWLARQFYRRGYNRLATGTELRRRYRAGWIESGLALALWFLDRQTRLLILKDFRLFRRDPAQWLQIVILGGLVVLYFTNIRRFFIGEISWEYQNRISLLNVFATSLLMCTYTGRFIYPMLSLEGKRFWILGLLPLPRGRLVWSKFVFSAVGSLLVAEFLVVLSDIMLGLPWQPLAIHILTIATMALGLSGLSVGLGALEPNFRETDPSRIAVGFGGTINLGLGLLYVLLVLGVMAGPWHLQAKSTETGIGYLPAGIAESIVVCGLVAGVVIGAIAAIVPMRLGIAALKRMEF